MRALLKGVEVDGGSDGPAIDRDWGEPGLTPAERVFGWNSFEVLAFTTGTPERPVNAIPGTRAGALPAALCRRHPAGRHHPGAAPPSRPQRLSQRRGARRPRAASSTPAGSIRTIPGSRGSAQSIERTSGAPPTILPNLGASLPNDIFVDVLGLKTIWIPHSYAGCSQHAPDEHLLAPIAREGLGLMAGLFWDLGEPDTPHRR